MSDFHTILSSASQLPIDERLDLIDALWQTVPEDTLPPLSDEWLAEIRRRSAEIDAGTAQTIPWEQAPREALRRSGIDENRKSVIPGRAANQRCSHYPITN